MGDRFAMDLHHAKRDIIQDLQARETVEPGFQVDLLTHVAFGELEDQIIDGAGWTRHRRNLYISERYRDDHSGKPTTLAMLQYVALVLIDGRQQLKFMNDVATRFKGTRKIECFKKMFLSLCVLDQIGDGMQAA